jgi:hypothetical protein
VGEATDQIRDQIDTQREQLGENLHQLEEKVKSTVDWRTQFEERPMLGMGIAFGTGFLLSMMLPSGSKSDSRSHSQSGGQMTPYHYDQSNFRVQDEARSWQGGGGYSGTTNFAQTQQRSPEMTEISETVENIRGAVMGLAATRLRSFLAEAVPGFKEEYEQARRKRGSSEASKIESTSTASSSGSTSGSTSGTTGQTDRSSWQTQGSGSGSSALRGGGDGEGGSQPNRMPAEPRTNGEQAYRP